MPTNAISANEKYRYYGCEIYKKRVKNMKITLVLLNFEDIPKHKLKQS